MKPEVKIRNWSVVGSGNLYRAPEADTRHVRGDVEDHPILGNKHGIHSSEILVLDLKGRRIETYNTIYLLEGPPDPHWIAFLSWINYDLTKLPE